MWTHRKNIIFCNQRCNPVNVVDMVKKTFYNTGLQNKSANLNCLDDVAGSKIMNVCKFHKVKH